MPTDQYSPLVPDQKILNEVKFASRDFVSMADDLLRRLKVEYGEDYNDYATTSQGIMLRDLVAWAYAALIWYLDRTASDNFLATSRTRAAAERLVGQIGYKIPPAAPSGTTLTLTFTNGTPSSFSMKDRWKFTGPDGLIFESYAKLEQPTVLTPGDQLSMAVRQGETRVLTYTSNGAKNQKFRLSSIAEDRYLGVNTIEVWVDGQLWEEKDFLEFEKTNHYEASYLSSPPLVRFGDGIAGNIPPAGSEIKIRFLIIDGARGNVKSNSIQTSVDTLVVGGETVVFTVNNASGASGGTDPEDIERVKKWAPLSFAARGVAITQQDYEALSNNFTDPAYGSVAKAYAINPRSSYEDIEFNGLVSDIDALLTAFSAEVTLLETSVIADAASLSPALSAIQSAVTDLGTIRTSMKSWVGAAKTGSGSSRASAADAEARASNAESKCTSALGTLGTLRSYIDDQDYAEETTLLGYVDSIITDVTVAEGEAGTAETSAATSKSAIDNSVTPNLGYLELAVADSGTMDLEVQDISNQATTISGLVVSIQTDVATIEGNAATLDTNITAKTTDMQMRIGELFSEDCLSNYVQVPILALDYDGNYTAPSLGLRTALQTYLDGIKGVTQQVEVIDGSSILVPAEIEIKVSILEAHVPAEVKSQIETAVIRTLKGRDFNSPLYLSDLYDVVNESSAGIDYVNVEITGPTGWTPDVLDSDGNLVPAANQVITFGSLSITGPSGEAI